MPAKNNGFLLYLYRGKCFLIDNLINIIAWRLFTSFWSFFYFVWQYSI